MDSRCGGEEISSFDQINHDDDDNFRDHDDEQRCTEDRVINFALRIVFIGIYSDGGTIRIFTERPYKIADISIIPQKGGHFVAVGVIYDIPVGQKSIGVFF